MLGGFCGSRLFSWEFRKRTRAWGLRYQAAAKGQLSVLVSGESVPAAVMAVVKADTWTTGVVECDIPAGDHALTFLWEGRLPLKLLELRADLE